jgi:hypothetical protein
MVILRGVSNNIFVYSDVSHYSWSSELVNALTLACLKSEGQFAIRSANSKSSTFIRNTNHLHKPFETTVLLDCPASFVPGAMRETGMRGALNGARTEAYG